MIGCRRWLARGFTLVELLIALAILGLLAVLSYRAVASLTDTEVRLAAEAEHWRALDTLFARLESDCREAVPREVRRDQRVEPAWVGSLDEQGNGVLAFSRAGAEFVVEPGSAGQRIAYRLRGDALEVDYWPGYDVAAGVAPAAYVLASGVTALAFSYLDSRGAWQPSWPRFGEPALPRAMRVELRLATGETIERLLALQ